MFFTKHDRHVLKHELLQLRSDIVELTETVQRLKSELDELQPFRDLLIDAARPGRLVK